MNILVLNAGSNSLKYKVFRVDKELLAGHVDGIGKQAEHTIIRSSIVNSETLFIRDHLDAVLAALKQVNEVMALNDITHVLHRVVHGGERFTEHKIITSEVEVGIEQLGDLAPLHNPANLAGIKAAKHALPNALHIAFFDTAFHSTIPNHAFLYGIPYKLYKKWGIRKYGFHGLSHQYIAQTVEHRLGHSENLVSCHLGSGSSICAIHKGTSIDTTMGFTPMDGILMATRSGELDPDIPLFLLEHEHYTIQELSSMLNKEAGIKGLIGTGDLREVKRKADNGDSMAKLVIDMLCYRIAMFIGSYHVAVGGMKILTFTGGIGQNAAFIRSGVCVLLEPLGVKLDEDANQDGKYVISAPGSSVTIMVIPADEELQMVRLFMRHAYS